MEISTINYFFGNGNYFDKTKNLDAANKFEKIKIGILQRPNAR